MNNRPTIGLVAALLGGYLLLVGGDLRGIKIPDLGLGGGGVKVPDVPPLIPPSGALRTAVEPLIGAVESRQVRAELASLHAALAEAVQRDTDNLTSTAKVRELNNRAGQLYYKKWGRSLEGEAPGVTAKMQTAFEAAMGGKANKTVDTETRAQIVAAYRAIAWAFTQ